MSVTDEISRILKGHLDIAHLEVVNESHLHTGHAGDDGSGESHFKVVVISNDFENMSRIERHRVVYDLLIANLQNMPHALSIKANSSKLST